MRRISENVPDVLDTWEDYLLSQMTKTTDPHIKSRAKTDEKCKNNENLQDMCKNHRHSVTLNTRGGRVTEKRRNLQNILSVSYGNYS